MKGISTLALIVSISCISKCQSYESKSLDEILFIGYQQQSPVFTNENSILYYLVENGLNEFIFLDSGKLPDYADKYIGAVNIEGSSRTMIENLRVPIDLSILQSSKLYRYKLDFQPGSIAADYLNSQIYMTHPRNDRTSNLRQLNFVDGSLNDISLTAIEIMLAKGILFYTSYNNPNQFDLVYDIYRVKLDDWDNPQKIFQKDYGNGLTVSDDGKYLIVEVIESGYSPQRAIYSIDDQKYAIIESPDLPEPVFWSRNKETFCFYDMRAKKGMERRFVYLDIPEEFPITPSWAMDFGDSFINTYWLEDANEDALRTLEKRQLRLLRNAIFARRGWTFQSEDLRSFFNQFQWYQDQQARYSDNSQIELTNSDKYRAQLIKKVEEKK